MFDLWRGLIVVASESEIRRISLFVKLIGLNSGFAWNRKRMEMMLIELMFVAYSLIFFTCYRPQTKLWKGNVFTPVCQSFCSQRGGGVVCLSACWDTHTHPRAGTLMADTPGQALPLGRHPSADSYCSGRYASYWYAFLFFDIFHLRFRFHLV